MRQRRSVVGVLLILVLGLAVPRVHGQDAESDAPEEARPVKRIKVYAENWKWIPDVIRAPQGTHLIIDFVSRDSNHSFLMKKGYKIKFALPEDSKKTLELDLDKAGTFRWRCGRPCGNGCAKMTGKLIVDPPAEDPAADDGS